MGKVVALWNKTMRPKSSEIIFQGFGRVLAPIDKCQERDGTAMHTCLHGVCVFVGVDGESSPNRVPIHTYEVSICISFAELFEHRGRNGDAWRTF